MITDRSQGWRGFIVLALAIVALVSACSHVRADDKPPLDCATVRAYVAQHGIVVAYARALAAGYTPRQIRDVRKRCGV